jgi:peptidylprolyl isomerase
MRRSHPLALTAMLLTIAACGGDDTATSSDSAGSVAATTAGPTTTIMIPISSDQCEDTPDPATYVEGQIPPAIRPCTIPVALGVHLIRPGIGRPAEPGDTVIVDYTGLRSEDGQVFDTSYTRGVPLDFPLGRGGVIAGWDDGLAGAQAGSLIKLDIPTELAYGDTPPTDAIQPGDALTFVIEVRAVIPSVTVADAPLDLQLEPSMGATAMTTNDIVVGDGAMIELGKTAVVHMLLVRGDNEIVLFNSWERDDPLQIVMEEGATLEGILDGLQGARVGTMRSIIVPPALGFGPDGEASLGLPAGTDLIVIAEVIGVY